LLLSLSSIHGAKLPEYLDNQCPLLGRDQGH